MSCVASPPQCGGGTCWPCRYAALQRENAELRAKLAEAEHGLRLADEHIHWCRDQLDAEIDRAEAAERERDALRAELEKTRIPPV